MWHVDNLKVSRKDPRRIDEVAEKLKQIYGEFKIKRGKIYDYLGMCLDYSEKGNHLKISMKEYIYKFIDEFPEVTE